MVRNGSSFRPSEYKKNHHHSRIVGGEIRKMRKREKAPLNIFLKNSQVCLSVYLAFSSSSSERASFLFGKEGGPSSSPLFWVEMGCPRSYPRNGAPGLYPTQPLFVHDGCLFRLLRVVIACQATHPHPALFSSYPFTRGFLHNGDFFHKALKRNGGRRGRQGFSFLLKHFIATLPSIKQMWAFSLYSPTRKRSAIVPCTSTYT